jgi:hypothetical protein
MRGYRGPIFDRIRHQFEDGPLTFHGHTVTLKRFVSSSAVASLAGLAPTAYYSTQYITALVRPLPGMLTQVEHQTPAGQIAAGQYQLTTREQIGRDDYIIWQGDTFRVNGPSVQTFLHSGYVTVIQRGDA